MNCISIENVSLRYPNFTRDIYSIKRWALAKVNVEKIAADTSYIEALKGVTISIGEGERVGIIGQNGAGKSTLLKVMSGVYEPTLGKVTIRGAVSPVLDMATGLELEMTGAENIYARGMMLGLSRKDIKAKIDEIIEFSELGHFIAQPVKTYSSGMFMRLAFSIATSIEPDILILDEIIGTGDLSFSQKSEIRLKELISSGRTVVLSSHSLEMVRTHCDRVIYLKNGGIELDGDVNEVLDFYIQQFTTQGVLS